MEPTEFKAADGFGLQGCFLSFTDDEYMSAKNTANMHAFCASAPRDMRRIAPQDIGAQCIGHFGFFRQRFAPTLWPQVSQWLALHTSA